MEPGQPGTAILIADFQERRSRLSFLQPIFGYPQLALIGFAWIPLAIADIVAWFALVITGREPAFHHRWLALWVSYTIRVWAYVNLTVGTYPGWSFRDPARYPVVLQIGPPKKNYSRLKALFRILYIIPAYLGAVIGGLVDSALLIVSAVCILVTGRQARWIFDLQCQCLRWYALYGLLINLVTEDYKLPVYSSSTDAVSFARQ